MRGPRPIPIVLTARQRTLLAQIVRRPTSPQAEFTRAQIILAAAQATNNQQIAAQLNVHVQTVRTWRGRWAEAADRLSSAEGEAEASVLPDVIHDLLGDAPRPGVPHTFTPEQICQLVALACERPENSGRPVTHWTPNELADEAIKRGLVVSISPRSVGRFLKRGGS